MSLIECEIRSFIAQSQYEVLVERFKTEAEFLGEDDQTTYYFNAKEDLRIQKNKNYSKIWFKKGQIHDEGREEIEIKFPREDFEKLEKLFLILGYRVEIKWFRKRLAFKWGDIDVALDQTRGYGYIIELEKMADDDRKTKTIDYLKKKLQDLSIPLTPKDEFDKKYKYYKKNWRQLTESS